LQYFVVVCDYVVLVVNDMLLTSGWLQQTTAATKVRRCGYLISSAGAS
jgi:hypothetical protein